MEATHKGWFLFCPVYLDMTDEDVPGMWARWEWMEPLLDAAHWCQDTMIGFLSATSADYEPRFLILVTKEL